MPGSSSEPWLFPCGSGWKLRGPQLDGSAFHNGAMWPASSCEIAVVMPDERLCRIISADRAHP